MRTLFLSVVIVICSGSMTFAQSNQSSTSSQRPQDPKVDSQNGIVDPVFTSGQLEKLPTVAVKPKITLKQAMKSAEVYAKRERIDLTNYFLIEATLMPDVENNTVENVRWYFRWVRYRPATEKEIVILVSMGGKASRLIQ